MNRKPFNVYTAGIKWQSTRYKTDVTRNRKRAQKKNGQTDIVILSPKHTFMKTKYY